MGKEKDFGGGLCVRACVCARACARVCGLAGRAEIEQDNGCWRSISTEVDNGEDGDRRTTWGNGNMDSYLVTCVCSWGAETLTWRGALRVTRQLPWRLDIPLTPVTSHLCVSVCCFTIPL